MTDILVPMLIVWAYFLGFVTAHACAHEHHSPFWKGFIDGLTLRRLWKRSHH